MVGDFFVRGVPAVNSPYLISLKVAEQRRLKIHLFVIEILFFQQLFLRNLMSKYVCSFIKCAIWSNFPKSVSFLHFLWTYWWLLLTCKSPTCSRASTDPCVVNDFVIWRNWSSLLQWSDKHCADGAYVNTNAKILLSFCIHSKLS